jgi:hypothetical protein
MHTHNLCSLQNLPNPSHIRSIDVAVRWATNTGHDTTTAPIVVGLLVLCIITVAAVIGYVNRG